MNVTFEKGMNIEPQYNLSLMSHNTTNVVYFEEQACNLSVLTADKQ